MVNLKQLFEKAFEEVQCICSEKSNEYMSLYEKEDLLTQCDILINRKCIPLFKEEDIINNFIISASSYSVLRKSFKVNSLQTIKNFDAHFDTNFFNNDIPQYNYKEWTNIVLTWGTKIFYDEFNSLSALQKKFENEYQKGDKSLKRKPKPRIVWTLASGLPIVDKIILTNPYSFIDEYHTISSKHPGQAYKKAKLFSENKRKNQKIVGMSTTLVCDFFKNIGLGYFVKIDVHMKDIIGDLSFKKLNDKELFILSWLISKEVDIEPFFHNYARIRFSSNP